MYLIDAWFIIKLLSIAGGSAFVTRPSSGVEDQTPELPPSAARTPSPVAPPVSAPPPSSSGVRPPGLTLKPTDQLLSPSVKRAAGTHWDVRQPLVNVIEEMLAPSPPPPTSVTSGPPATTSSVTSSGPQIPLVPAAAAVRAPAPPSRPPNPTHVGLPPVVSVVNTGTMRAAARQPVAPPDLSSDGGV
jgi:hypothetical protein